MVGTITTPISQMEKLSLVQICTESMWQGQAARVQHHSMSLPCKLLSSFSLTTLQWTLLPSLPLQYRLSVNKTTQEPSPGLSALRLSNTSQSVMQIAPIAISQKFKSVITQLKIFQWPPTAGRNNVPNPHKALRPTQSNSP